MKFQPIDVILKNQSTVTIRMCQIEDAEEIIQTVKIYLLDSEFIPLEADEFNPTIEQEKEFIQSFIDNDNSLLLVAIYKGQIIGNIDLTGSQRKALKHTAVVGMGILKEWRNSGLGTALIHSAIDWTKHNSVLEKLILHVFSTNEAGIMIYKKAGFIVEGVQKNLIKIDDNCYVDSFLMGLEV